MLTSAVSFWTLYTREIQIMWSQSETETNQRSLKNQGRPIKCSTVPGMRAQHKNATRESRATKKNKREETRL